MIGQTAKAGQYFERSGSESTKGTRGGANLLGGGIDPTLVLSEQEERASRQAALKARLDVELEALKVAKAQMIANFGKGDPYFKARSNRDRIGKAIQEIHAELSKIKGEYSTGTPRALLFHFAAACRDSLTNAQFVMLMKEAHKRAAAESEVEP